MDIPATTEILLGAVLDYMLARRRYAEPGGSDQPRRDSAGSVAGVEQDPADPARRRACPGATADPHRRCRSAGGITSRKAWRGVHRRPFQGSRFLLRRF